MEEERPLSLPPSHPGPPSQVPPPPPPRKEVSRGTKGGREGKRKGVPSSHTHSPSLLYSAEQQRLSFLPTPPFPPPPPVCPGLRRSFQGQLWEGRRVALRSLPPLSLSKLRRALTLGSDSKSNLSPSSGVVGGGIADRSGGRSGPRKNERAFLSLGRDRRKRGIGGGSCSSDAAR